IDTNKLVQAYDAALALQYSVGLNPLPTMDPLPWSNWRLAVANVDTVGNVTANDASLILQHSAKLISTFPADAKKRGGDAPTANVTVTQEGNQLVFRASGTLYAFNVFMKDNFNVFGQPEVKDKSVMVASNLNTSTYNVGLASTKPFIENEPFLVIPILTNENVQGVMDIVANTEEKSLIYGKAAGISSLNKEVVLVYPNPTKDVVTINNAQGKTLRIVDVQGKEVYNQKVNASSMEVSMKTLGSKGMYVLHIVDANNESVQTKQIVLE
ncbi:MAG: T9SS type A sorting domain-containing protein, partial [Crocinitomicaceae bacterium]